MKKSLVMLLLLNIAWNNDIIGQGLQVGIKGSFNSTWLVNKHTSDAPAKEQTYVPSFGQSYGLSGAIFFNKRLGVEMNLFYDTHRQKYSDDNETFESETKLNRLSVPLMIKIRSETGAFVEIGAIYNVLTSAKFSLSVDSLSFPDRDIKDLMSNASIDAMLGIGVDIPIVAGLSLTTALRFWGSLTDLKGVDAYGGDLSDPTWLFIAYGDTKYEPTHAFAVGFLMGLTYSIGKIAGD